MTNDTFSGVGVALVTPFNQDLEVDYAGLKKLLDHTSNGADYWVAHGTTGESVTTTKEEKVKILDFIKRNNPRKLPLVVGIGGNYTEDVIKKIKDFDLDGVDAVLSVSPYYNRPAQEGIVEHFVKLADVSPKPIILYNVPSRTGSNMTAETTLKLADHPNIQGIKDSSCNYDQLCLIAKYKPSGFKLISGDDMFTLPLLAIGGEGVISVLANAYPAHFGSMVQNMLNSEVERAREILLQLIELNPLMYTEGSPTGVKQLLEHMNICKNYVRLPMMPATEKLKAQIAEKMILLHGKVSID
jgi:4-hydroxy-tetrahydrodipicolinate synthase